MSNSNPLQILETLSLYVHVPFCRKKCHYCDFYSLPQQGDRQMRRVLQETLSELDYFWQRLGKPRLRTIYIGGGTPSLLSPANLSLLLQDLNARPRGCPSEWSIEANPESLSRDFLNLCREGGVSRLSLGIQSFQDSILRHLGRPGDAAENRRALEDLATHWPGRVNLDLLAGVPEQNWPDLQEDLEAALVFDPGHLSLYQLSPPPESPLADRIEPELQDKLWLRGFQYLQARGYLNYEISNFARPGQECRHNLGYWNLEPYLGVGPGAVSTLPLESGEILRLYNPERIDAFLQDRMWSIRSERIAPREFLLENLIMGLRLGRGIDKGRFLKRFGRPLPEILDGLWQDWQGRGYVRPSERAYALTQSGRLMLNRLLLEVIELQYEENLVSMHP